MNVLRGFACLIALAVSLNVTALAHSCPFCEGEKAETLAVLISDSQLVLLGRFTNAKPGAGLGEGQSDFIIERAYKDHPIIKGVKKITIPRNVPNEKSKFLIFGDVYKGKIDAYKGVELTSDNEMVRYIEGVIKLKDSKPGERLRFAFDFLNSPEYEIAMDAYREFARADYRDYKDMARKLPADTIAGWLKDPKTPSYRYGLYSSLLGHCGNAKHAELLMSMINDPEKRKGSGLHGLMSSYTMLEPQKGWAFVKELVQSNDKPFLVRYAGLQTMRFLREYRPDLVNPKDDAAAKTEIVKGVAGILNVSDMADFAIEDLRKWQRWEYCDQILGLYGKSNFNTSIIRKSILRYALQCETPQAQAFVKAQRAIDAEFVDDTRELLELETPIPVKAPNKK